MPIFFRVLPIASKCVIISAERQGDFMDNKELNNLSEPEDFGSPEELIVHSDEELLQKLLEAEEDIKMGRVIPYEEFRREVFEKYGF